MQIFPQSEITDATGFDLMNSDPARDMAERTAMFAKVLDSQAYSETDGEAARGRILDLAEQGREQARKASGMRGQTAETFRNLELKTGEESLSRLKAALAAANSGSSSSKKNSVDFTGAAARQGIRNFTSMKPVDGDTPQTLKMTLQDWTNLKKDLLKHGLDQTDIDTLEDQVTSQAGLTWGSFVHYLSANAGLNTTTIEFSDKDKQGLSAFFTQMGFTAGETESLIRNLSAQNYGDVFKTMSGKISELAEFGSSPEIGRQEALSFISSLNLPKSALEQLKSLLAKTDDLSLGELNRVMNAAQKYVQINQGSKKADDEELAELVSSALRKALENSAEGMQADRFGDHATKERINAKSGVSKDILEGDKQADGEEQTARASAATEADASGKEKSSTKDTLFAKAGAQTRDATTKTEQQEGASTSKDVFAQFSKKSKDAGDTYKSGEELFEEDPKDSAKDKSWKEFLGKVKVEDSSGSQTAKTIGAVMDEALATADKGMARPGANTSGAAKDAAQGSSVFNQLNSGVFKNLGQGRTQLTVQLQPEDLGTLNVLLQVRNKEVRATIKADSPEAARLVGEQLEHIKQTLQEQGLKVSKLDVQTSTTGNHGGTEWQGEAGHNQAREQEEMSQTLAQWRNMRSEGESLAREMQPSGERENLSRSGLHIVA